MFRTNLCVCVCVCVCACVCACVCMCVFTVTWCGTRTHWRHHLRALWRSALATFYVQYSPLPKCAAWPENRTWEWWRKRGFPKPCQPAVSTWAASSSRCSSWTAPSTIPPTPWPSPSRACHRRAPSRPLREEWLCTPLQTLWRFVLLVSGHPPWQYVHTSIQPWRYSIELNTAFQTCPMLPAFCTRGRPTPAGWKDMFVPFEPVPISV